VLRTAGDPALLANPVRAAVAELDQDLALADVQTMASVVGMSTAPQRFSARLLAGFSFAAVLLAVVGLYGVLAFAVSERSIEIGIRLALGARKQAVFGMVVGVPSRPARRSQAVPSRSPR
jgi:putative ABC transport system permease protein